MKTKLLALLAIALLVSCEGSSWDNAKEITTAAKQFVRIDGRSAIIYTVTLDGVEYYATQSSAGCYALCPKLQPSK